jgi:hypothetical protein
MRSNSGRAARQPVNAVTEVDRHAIVESLALLRLENAFEHAGDVLRLEHLVVELEEAPGHPDERRARRLEVEIGGSTRRHQSE